MTLRDLASLQPLEDFGPSESDRHWSRHAHVVVARTRPNTIPEIRARSGTGPATRRCRRPDHVDQACSPSIRLNQLPWRTWRSGSGLPMPANGSRRVSSMSLLIRFTIFLSTDCQWR